VDGLSLLNEIESKSGENISACYQCYRCTNGCPVAADMDIYPHRIIRHVILGGREKVLSSGAIWTCLQCTTCSVRCPNDIDIAHVFDTLRKIAVAEHREAEKDTWNFYKFFLGMLPHNIKDRKALKETFEKIEAERREGEK
jgi:heterodisulfide reductase subunit C